MVICNEKREILFLGKTRNGKMHDKKMSDMENLKFRKGTVLLQDSGYVGYMPKNVVVMMPIKKPKGKNLTKIQKKKNHKISSKRVLIENVICGIKIMRIAKDKCRSSCSKNRDESIFLAAAMHNFRVKKRKNKSKINQI